MMLVSNSVQANDVVKETRNGDRYLIVQDVPFVRAMTLSGGYVPQSEIKQSTNAWAGTPLTANHPRNERGEPVPANTKLNEVGVGKAENPRFDGTWIRANLAVNADRAKAMGGVAADIVAKIESGETFDVSSQYLPKPLPEGEYDGKHRSNVEGIAQPDSIALLPHKPGKCSIEDGCGIKPQMAANADVRVPMTRANNHGEGPSSNADFSEGDLVEWEFGQGVGQGRVEEVVSEAGEEISVDGGTRIAKEDDPAVLLSSWEGDGFDGEDTVKLMSNLSEWSNPPDEAMSANAEVPDKYSFDNPGEAMSMAQDMGLDAIHTHGSGDDTVFMPGQSHEALVEMLEEEGMMSNATDMALTDVGPGDVDSYTDSEWDGSAAIAGMPNPSESDENAEILDQAHLVHPTSEDAGDDKSNWKLPFRDGPDAPVNTRALVAAKAALEGARGGVEGIPEADKEGALERIEDFLNDAPNDLFGSMAVDDASKHMDMEDNVVSNVLTTVADLLGMDSTGDEPAESGADVTTNNDTMEREELIDEITSNSKLTEAALAERCDDGLEAIHSDVMDNDTMSDNSEDVAELKDRIDELESKLTANEKEEKEQIAETIVANSNEYEDTEDVLDDYPTEAALEAKQDSLNVGGSMPGMGTTANTDFGTDDEFDVGSGVLTE